MFSFGQVKKKNPLVLLFFFHFIHLRVEFQEEHLINVLYTVHTLGKYKAVWISMTYSRNQVAFTLHTTERASTATHFLAIFKKFPGNVSINYRLYTSVFNFI